jgi:hypothetical protein
MDEQDGKIIIYRAGVPVARLICCGGRRAHRTARPAGLVAVIILRAAWMALSYGYWRMHGTSIRVEAGAARRRGGRWAAGNGR